MTDDVDLEELKRQTSQGDRIDEAASQEDHHALVDAIVAELETVAAGDKQKTISLWDGHLAAFIRALDENPEQLQEVGHALQQQLDIEVDEVDRSEVLRLALRLGFQQAAPQHFESLRDAAQKHAIKDL